MPCFKTTSDRVVWVSKEQWIGRRASTMDLRVHVLRWGVLGRTSFAFLSASRLNSCMIPFSTRVHDCRGLSYFLIAVLLLATHVSYLESTYNNVLLPL
jgi:hypothetical protein